MAELSGRASRREERSLFGPIVLIAIGVYFLLHQLDLVTGLHWWTALQLWPLLLIFGGLNIIAQQVRYPYGLILSGLVGLSAVAVFGYVLLFGVENTFLGSLSVSPQGEFKMEQVAFPAGDVDTATVHLNIAPPGARVFALEDSNNLIEGTIYHHGRLLFDTETGDGQAVVTLATKDNDFWFFGPGNWDGLGGENRWQIGLNPNVPLALALDVNAGLATLDLSRLTLNSLAVTVNASDADLLLPDGDYSLELDVNAGSLEATLPKQGDHSFQIEVNGGSLVMALPDSAAARIEVHRSLGSFNLESDRFRQISQDGSEEIWETAGYANARNQIILRINVSAGSVNVQES
ncbi:MAG: DUF5668 domain-containing protein [Chloroflexi bacterium]|nr:DUF5668 domain-containing protein [Chloroflexota bacterium]MCI0579923.1 DUF5668 domain-containing protein [Chloroflexota bacterium]MCI0646506.1 DUF5668 domain-containing protein [Chloroflexota bacterium]MCI0726142.1 DUF5668 domain-containing protein [Chloroflexota bacterium]